MGLSCRRDIVMLCQGFIEGCDPLIRNLSLLPTSRASAREGSCMAHFLPFFTQPSRFLFVGPRRAMYFFRDHEKGRTFFCEAAQALVFLSRTVACDVFVF